MRPPAGSPRPCFMTCTRWHSRSSHPALIVGAFAERMKFSAMLVFTALWLTLCYVPICHWIWGGGWLEAATASWISRAEPWSISTPASQGLAAARWCSDRERDIPRRRCPRTTSHIRSWGPPCCGSAGSGSTRAPMLAADGVAGMALAGHAACGDRGGALLRWMFCEWGRHGKPSVLGSRVGRHRRARRRSLLPRGLSGP